MPSETLTPELEPRTAAARGTRAPGRRIRLGALVAVAVAIGFVLWLVLGNSGSKPAAQTGDGTPVPISVAGLRTLAEAVPSVIYWLGPMDGVTYELTHTSSNRVFVRYLPAGVAIGSDKPYLTVATYPFPNAYAATERASRQPGAVVVPVEAGAIAFYNRSRPQSVFFSEQGSAYQVEVFDPSGARARSAVSSGRVQPVVDRTAAGATAVTAGGLRALAGGIGHPIYWLGAKPGLHFELTQTSTGKIFIRYLPGGVAIGAAEPYLTVATYPFPNAYAALQRVAKKDGGQSFGLAGGGLAVVDAQYPKSIHLAYPSSAYQIEVFDPSPAEARSVVVSGQVQPVRSSSTPAMRRPFRIGAVIAIALAAGFVAWLFVRGSSSSGTSGTGALTTQQTQRAAAVAATPDRLRSLASSVEHPVFWLGPKSGYTYELTQTTNGKIYVRYLPTGVAVGADKPYLTVATYPFPGAFAAIRKQAAAKGAATVKLAHGGIAVLDQAYPESVHLAYPGVNYQVEVYDPTPARAMQLVSAGQVTNFGSLAAAAAPATTTSATPTTAPGQPTAATLAQLHALATSLGHPIYWAGPKTGYTYELTETSSGKVYIRYLPAGVEVGDKKADYLTIATYPFPGAFAAVEKTASGASTIKLARGGIAVVDTTYPKSIHLAYPGSSYQVEVFDPSPARVRQVVVSGQVKPLG